MFDFIGYLERQNIWSDETFGKGRRLKGVLAHIRKELEEIEASSPPDDLAEWCDVVILACNGAWRAGYTPEQIAEQLLRKQQINFRRKWPPHQPEDVAVEHIR